MFELNRPSYTEMLLAALSITLIFIITFSLKKISGNKLKRPNGKKGGIISFHAAMALCIITLIAILTRDWFITLLTVILVYLIIKSRITDNHHWTWQVVFGAIVGASVPFLVFYVKENGFKFNFNSNSRQKEPTPTPENNNPLDNRTEAVREAPNLALEDFD